MVDKQEFQTLLAGGLKRTPLHHASAGVLEDVAGELGGGRDDPGRVGDAEPEGGGGLAHGPPGQDDVRLGCDDHF